MATRRAMLAPPATIAQQAEGDDLARIRAVYFNVECPTPEMEMTRCMVGMDAGRGLVRRLLLPRFLGNRSPRPQLVSPCVCPQLAGVSLVGEQYNAIVAVNKVRGLGGA